MDSSRFNSVHLAPGRREEFRHARNYLMQSCGEHTLQAEKLPIHSGGSSHTIVERGMGSKIPDGVACWLADKNRTYPLKVGLNTVGRSSDNDVVIRDGFISRRHCTLLVHSDYRVELHDTASKNGTYVNGAKMKHPTRLRVGDEIRMCDCVLTFDTSAYPSSGSQAHTNTRYP